MCHLSKIYFIKNKIIGEVVGCGRVSGQNGTTFKYLLASCEHVSLIGALSDREYISQGVYIQEELYLTTINYCTQYKVALSKCSFNECALASVLTGI